MMRASHLFLIFNILVAGVAFGDDADETKAIKKIELPGAKVTRDEVLPGRPVIGIDMQGNTTLNDKYVHLLKAFPYPPRCTEIDDHRFFRVDIGEGD